MGALAFPGVLWARIPHGRITKMVATVAVATVIVGGASLVPGSTTTPTSPSGVDIWVATNGNDSTCVRGDQAFPCATLNKAYQIAQCGDEVEVGNGTYSSAQTISSNSSLSDCSSRVVFDEPATGAGAAFANSVSIDYPASHIELRDLTINPYLNLGYQNLGSSCGNDPVRDIAISNLDVQSFHMSCVNGVDWEGGDVGPAVSDSVEHPYIHNAGDYVPQNITLSGILFHDITQSGASHTECLLLIAGDQITIENNVFSNCQSTGPLYITIINIAGAQDVCTNIVVQNNWFLGRSDASFNLVHFENDCEILVRNNSFSGGARPHLLDYQNHGGGSQETVTLVGNYGSTPSSESGWTCDEPQANFVFSYNVFEDVACSGTGNVSVASTQFVDSTSDLHLTSGANAVDQGDPADFPSTDIDGDTRPIGSAPDAGADEKE